MKIYKEYMMKTKGRTTNSATFYARDLELKENYLK
jgi:hypothetical protein